MAEDDDPRPRGHLLDALARREVDAGEEAIEAGHAEQRLAALDRLPGLDRYLHYLAAVCDREGPGARRSAPRRERGVDQPDRLGQGVEPGLLAANPRLGLLQAPVGDDLPLGVERPGALERGPRRHQRGRDGLEVGPGGSQPRREVDPLDGRQTRLELAHDLAVGHGRTDAGPRPPRGRGEPTGHGRA